MAKGTLAYIRQNYGVPARLRGRVTVNGKPGRITGTHDAHLYVRLDEGGRRLIFHPTDPALVYQEIGATYGSHTPSHSESLSLAKR